MIKIYTDGSCIGNPGNGGWAAIIIENGKKTQIQFQRNGIYGLKQMQTTIY